MAFKPRISFSKAAALGRCGWQYHLTRELGIKEVPSLAMAGGSAFHSYVEDYELHRLFPDAGVAPLDVGVYFGSELAKLEQQSGMPRAEFKVSGRRTKERPDKETELVWRSELLPQMVDGYLNFDWGDWEIATDLPRDSGQHGSIVGVEYMIELRSPVHFVMHADQIRKRKTDGNYGIFDLKTGQRIYTSAQIPQYIVAARKHGINAWYGGYYNARKAELDGPHLGKWTDEVFDHYVTTAQQQVASELRLPVVDEHCGWCGVRESCVFAS